MRISDGSSDVCSSDLAARGYGESIEALVADHAPLVRKIAWQVFSRVARTSELDDLIQTGLIALIEASRHYEERGYAFATYASTRIRGAMIDQLRREAEVGRSAMIASKRIQTVRRDLERSEEHTSELQSLMRLSYAVFCLKKKKNT